MAQNRQLQKIAPPKIRRIRHRRRSANVSDARFAGRHPALANFLSREATRYNALGGVAGVTSAEILASVEGVGTSTLNRNCVRLPRLLISMTKGFRSYRPDGVTNVRIHLAPNTRTPNP
jgi:hypothetical protein